MMMIIMSMIIVDNKRVNQVCCEKEKEKEKESN